MVKPVYPSLEDPQFAEKIAHMEDFSIFQIPPSKSYSTSESFEQRIQEMCQFEKTYYQHFVSQYISKRTPYKSLLLYHGLGSGKSCSAITIAESFNQEQRLEDTPNVWVISRKALKGSFEQEIFRTLYLTLQDKDLRNQCTGDAYLQMIPNASQMPYDKLVQRIQKIIKSKYKFFGYDQFANTIEKLKQEGTFDQTVQNKVIIVDEAHNLRNLESVGNKQKRIIEPFVDVFKYGKNNRLVLLSATPMYNEAEEILWLLSLLLLNDKRPNILDPFKLPSFYTHGKPNKEVFKLCASLSQTYISYIKGNNPFTFAVRLPPSKEEVTFLKDVPKIGFSGKPLEKEDLNWLTWIKDGLVVSTLGQTQIDAIQSIRQQKHASSATLRQMNIFANRKLLGQDTYEYRDGKDGLLSIFRRADELEPIQYVYQRPKEPLFDPSYGKLNDFACKLETLSHLIRSSKGIVLIYSMFIWGGIVPTALMLEHLGFSRYKERDFLRMNRKASDPVDYEGITKPSYCILSSESDKELMGATKIDDLLKDINTEENKYGKNIKVILISPVAGEGLSFKNIREMHVLDPWYHLNNQEQAIGRAIRNCSHIGLPLEERNVTVFLHSTVYPGNDRETSDLHAYRLASHKYKEIQEVDKVIQTHALDCSLMKQINYYSPDQFPFKIVLHTSRGKQLPYQYGDVNEPVHCTSTGYKAMDHRAFREESYQSFLPTLQGRLRKYLKDSNKIVYTYEDLLTAIHPNVEVSTKVIEASLMPYRLWENKVLVYHMNEFRVMEVDKKIPLTTRLQLQEELKKEVVSDCSLEPVLEQLDKESDDRATLKIYQALDSKCWVEFAERIIQTPTEEISSKLKKALSLLERQGAFILKSEVGSNTPSNYSGYIDLFSVEDQFNGIVWDETEFRELTSSEKVRLERLRKKVPFINPIKERILETIGFVQRHKGKEPEAPYRFQFKLGFNNEKSKRSGVVCETLKKPQIEQELKSFQVEMKANVSQMCFQLSLELFNANRFWLPPVYKPK